jgi:hypothetical protein
VRRTILPLGAYGGELRTGIGAADSHRAVAWFEDHDPDWRREDAASATTPTRHR